MERNGHQSEILLESELHDIHICTILVITGIKKHKNHIHSSSSSNDKISDNKHSTGNKLNESKSEC